MTYDERREIDTYLDIVKKNAERLSRSVNMLQELVDKSECVIAENEDSISAKDKFLKTY